MAESESESESEEEETNRVLTKRGDVVGTTKPEPPKQQQQDEESSDEEESDTDSDSEPAGSRYNTVKADNNNSKVATKAVAADSLPAGKRQGKRGRDVNGVEGAPTQEPLSKKKKDAKEDKGRSQGERQLSSPVKKGEKPEQQAPRGKAASAAKSEKVKAVPPAGKVENVKSQATAGRKKKTSSPPPAPASGSGQQVQKVEVDKSSPMKPKKAASWTNAAEESLVSQLHKDHKSGLGIPASKHDPYWEKLLKRVSHGEGLTELQVFDKVKRMKVRYNTLKERPKGGGEKVFKSPHEEKIFKVWADMWDSGTKNSQPATTEEEESEDESAGTTTAATGRVIKGAATQVKGGESSDSEEEDEEEEEAENMKRKTAGLNQVTSASKPIPEPVPATPFISKPKLSFTPLLPKVDKQKLDKKVEEVISRDDHTVNAVAVDVGKKGHVDSLASEHWKQLREETHAFFQELQGSCFQAIEEQRNGSLTGGLGNFAFAFKGFGPPGIMEGFIGGTRSQPAIELQRKWREHKIQELALLSERLELLQEQCRLYQEELRLQNQRLDK